MGDHELKKYDKIDRYLKGVMPKDERKAFELELTQNDALKDELEKTDISRKAVQYQGLRDEVQHIRNNMLHETSDRKKTAIERPLPVGFYALRIAASLLLVLLVFAAIQATLVDPQGIYADKINYEVVDVVERSGEESVSLSTILEAYQKDNFQDAVAIFAQQDNPTVKEQYIAAAAYLQLAEYEQAASNYKQILSGDLLSEAKDFWQQKAAYNLAITQIMLGRYDEAIAILQELKSNQEYGDYYDQLVSDYALWKLRLCSLKNSLIE
jgi:tetratricopeptide (TPR) repeat protein